MSTRNTTLPRPSRSLAMLVCALLVAAVMTAFGSVGSAQAVGTVLFQNAFNNRTVDGTGTVVVPTPASGTNAACLTASGNSATGPLRSCPSSTDAQGAGKLRMTAATGNQIGGIFGATSFPTSNGLDVTFNTYQYGGGGADGMAFMLAAVDPANPTAPTTIGPGGGSLGYSPSGSIRGLPNAYLGVGLDVFGNYSSFGGSGCPSVPNINASAPGAVVVRGPGNALVGYCALTSTYNGTAASRVTLRATTRAASVVPVQVLINPTGSTFTSSTGQSVSPGTYKVIVTPVGQSVRTISGTLPTVANGVYPSTTWLANGVPKQLAFGFVGSTGGTTDAHEASDVRVLTFNPVPQLNVESTSYTAAAPQPGAPVTYTVVGSVAVGADETQPISITQTVPTGVVPAGAYGTGWNCATPVGQTVTCTTTGSTFANGTSLPPITVVGIVTGTSVTASSVQTGSSSRISSSDGNPATDATTTAGSLPPAPANITVTPTIGSTAGGNAVTVGGSNITNATAIEIGTTTEQTGGTPVTLFPCVAPTTTGCFTVSGGTLVIASMPARASATPVTLTVVTSGLAASGNYSYASAPAAPAAPVASAGVTSTTVTWAEPASNGSAITGYTISQYLGANLMNTTNVGISQLSRAFTGLTPGGSYSYAITATNAYGTSTASARSNTAVPYTLPGAPTVTAVNAGTGSATLSWNAPASDGFNPISGYVVTPYIGTTAQPAQSFASAATTQIVTGLSPGTAYTFTVQAQNAAGTGGPSARSAAVTPNASPSITTPASVNGEVNVPFSRQLTVAAGTSPFTWSISSGTLPTGLGLNSTTGVLSGTPTAASSTTVTLRVVDASGQSATKTLDITIAAAPGVAFTPPGGEVEVPYSAQPVLTGGTPEFVWSITAGSLPTGVTQNTATGQLTGTPTTAGTFTATVTATDSFGQTASRTVTITIAALPTFSSAPPANAQVGVAYSTTFSVAGGTAPLGFAITAGTLPAGLSLNSSTGVVSGTPSTASSVPFTITVTDANGKSANRTATITVNAGPLLITKSANVTSAAPGSVISYSIVITNSTTTPFQNVSLSESLAGVNDDASYNRNVNATTGAANVSAGVLTWSGTVPASGSVSITYTYTVKPAGSGDGVLTSTVTSTTLGTNCASSSTDARCSATVTVPGLTLTITPSAATATPADVVTYTVEATNSGKTPLPTAAFSVNLAGALDDGSYNPGSQASSGTLSYSAPTLSWTGNLPVGASVVVTYSLTVNSPDSGDRALTSSVSSTTAGSTCPTGTASPACSATVSVRIPALAISTTADRATATPGTVVRFTTTIANTGQTAYTGATVTTALGGVLDDASYGGDVATTAGSVAFDAASKSFIWTGDLVLGASVTVSGTVTVNSTSTGDKTLTATSRSTAPGSTCLPSGAPASCSATVQVLIPALTLALSSDVATTTPGSTVNYTVTANNTGQTPYTGAALAVALADVLDDADVDGLPTATSGAAAISAGTLSWVGDLAVAASATIRFSVTAHSPPTGDLDLVSSVSSPAPGANCTTGSADAACSNSVQILVPGLAVTSGFGVATTTPGSALVYTATVTNTGQTTYTGAPVALDLSGALDDATYNRDARVTAGSITIGADSGAIWSLSLAPGESATVTLSLTVSQPDLGDRSIRARISSAVAGSTCPPASSAEGCVATTTVLVPGLVIVKTADRSTVTPGGAVQFTIRVTNTGETSYAAASFSDPLTTVLTDAGYTGDASTTAGSVSYDAATTTLSWTGALDPGQSALITYSVVVLDPDPGDKRMTNTVTSGDPGNNCFTGSTDARCTAVVTVLVPALTISNTADTTSTTPGASVTSTVTVTNTGQTAYPSVTVVVPLADVLDDATVSGGPSASSGTVQLSGGVLTWTGPLALGQVVEIGYVVLVNIEPGGDDVLTSTASSPVSGSTCPTAGGGAACTSSVPVARLVIEQSYGSPTTTPGSTIRLNASFTNTGAVDYTGITVESPSAGTVDDAIPVGDQHASSGTLSLTSTAIVWSGNIAVGQTVTVTGTLVVASPPTGDRNITGTLRSTAPGSNCPPGGSDQRCTASALVLVPALSSSIAASTSATVPGGTVGYTVTISNTGQTPYTATAVTAALTGSLDDAVYNGDAKASSGAAVFADSAITWTGDLQPGAAVTVTYSLTVRNPDPADKTMTAQLSSDATGSTCPPASGAAACRSIVAVLTPALTIQKSADLSNVTLGSPVGYTITVANTGQTSYPSASFTDALSEVLDDATLTPGSLAATAGTVSVSGGTISWSGALAIGASATITYGVTVTSPSTGDRTLRNTVVSPTAGSNCAASSTDTRCTVAVAVTNAVSLTIEKTSDVDHAAAGDTVVYTVTATNSSASTIAAVTFTDGLADVLDDADFDGGSLTADLGTPVFTGTAITWQGDLAAGARATVTYSVTLTDPDDGDQRLESTVSSTSLPASNNCAPAGTDPRCSDTVLVAALLLTQQYSDTSTTPGSLVRLTATFTNTGQYPYTGITIKSPSADTVDDAIPTGDQAASSGDLILTPGAVVWTGSIPVGGTVTITGTLTITQPDTGNRVLRGTLNTDAIGSNCPVGGTDARCTATLPVLLPGLTITTTANTTFVVPGGTVTYTVQVTNSGETAYTGAVVTDSLTGVLDDAVYNGDATASIGSVGYDEPVLTWTGDLPVGSTAVITYTVTASSPGTGDKTMVNPVSSAEAGSTCPPFSNQPGCRSTVAVLTPALTLTSTADTDSALPGSIVTFTVTARNSGQVPYGDARFTVPLTGVLDDSTDGVLTTGPTADSGTATVDAASRLDWNGALAVGATATISYSVTVATPSAGPGASDAQLTQTVSSTSSGATCSATQSDARCSTTVAISSLLLTNTADVAEIEPTGVVTYTGTFTNTGTVPYTGITVRNSFVGALDDASYNGDAGATSGSLVIVVGSGQVVWTGDVAVGQTVTITGSLTVNYPETGDGTMRTVLSTTAPATNCAPGSADPLCTSDTTVLHPELAIESTADRSTVQPGGTVTYTTVIENSGETVHPGATVDIDLAAALGDAAYPGGATATSGTVTFAGTTLTWSGPLGLGELVTVSYALVVDDPDLGDRNLATNTSSSALGSTCPPGSTSAACSTLVTVLVPALQLSIVADRSTATPGDGVGYTATIANTGQTHYVGATAIIDLTGALDDAAYPDARSASRGTLSGDAGSASVIWTGDLAPGETALVTYTLVVAEPDAGDRVLTSSIDSVETGSACDPTSSCLSQVTVLIPGLAITQSADRASTTPGSQVVFTITVSNTGQTPYNAAELSSELSGILDDGAIVPQSLGATAGVATITSGTLDWVGTLAVGATAVISYTVIAADPPTGDRELTSLVVSDEAGSTCRAGSASPACSVSTVILIPGLQITTTAGSPTTTPNGSATFTVVIANTGETDYTGAVVTDSLAGLVGEADYNGDALADSGSLVLTGDALVWTGDLLMGAETRFTFSVTAHDPQTGDRLLVNTVGSAEQSSSCPVAVAGGSGADAPAGCAAEVQVLIPGLSVTTTPSATVVVAGASVGYTLVVTNTGETDYPVTSVVDDLGGVLDDAVYNGDATATTGSVVLDGEELRWSGPVPVGTSVIITFSITASFPAEGDRTIRDSVSSPAAHSSCTTGEEAGCSSTVTVLVPALSVTKSAAGAEVVAGGTLAYTIVATNTGEADFTGVTLVDDLGGVIDDAVYNGDAVADLGSIGTSATTITWTGDLLRGQSVTIGYSVTARLDSDGDAVLVNSVSSPTVGSSCTTGEESGCSVAVAVAPRSITLQGLTNSFTLTGTPGSTVTRDEAVAMTVITNSSGGYTVSVRPLADQLVPADPGNGDTIPIEQLRVRDAATQAFTPLSTSGPIITHRQDRPSSPGGDAVSDDYEVEIPFVSSDTYSVELDYIVSAQ